MAGRWRRGAAALTDGGLQRVLTGDRCVDFAQRVIFAPPQGYPPDTAARTRLMHPPDEGHMFITYRMQPSHPTPTVAHQRLSWPGYRATPTMHADLYPRIGTTNWIDKSWFRIIDILYNCVDVGGCSTVCETNNNTSLTLIYHYPLPSVALQRGCSSLGTILMCRTVEWRKT